MDERVSATIIHVDLDAFYASVERLKDPTLEGKPMAVGGGVILSPSYEARQFGVRSGMAIGAARRLCPRLVTVSGSFGDYTRLSDQVFEVCRDYTPVVEQTSIDEAFLDVAGSVHLFGPATEIARQIREDVARVTGLPLSAGIARTKFLAKVASREAKPSGQIEVKPEGELEFLHPLDVGVIWGVGAVTRKRLAELGIKTVGDLAAAPAGTLSVRLGPGLGRHLHALAWNRDQRLVTTYRRARSIGAQSALGRRTPSQEHPAILASLADRIARRLRSKNRWARTITLRIRFSDMSAATRSFSLGAPIATSAAIHGVALQLLELGRSAGPQPVTLLGLSLTNIVTTPHIQLELGLDGADVNVADSGSEVAHQRLELERAVDELQRRFGRDAVSRASTGLGPGGVPDEFRDLAVPRDERSSDEDG